MQETTQTQTGLSLIDPLQLKKELQVAELPSVTGLDEPDQAVVQLADEFVRQVLDYNPDDPGQVAIRQGNIASIENLGAKVQKDSAVRSAMLKEPIRKLAAKGEDGGEVANALVDLNMQVEELDPGEFDLEPGWAGRLLGMIPGVGKPMKRYFLKFESAQIVLDAILRSLNGGADMLKRDNITLAEDQQQMRLTTHKLTQTIQLGQVVDQRLGQVLEQEIPSDDARYPFIQEELLFPLRQRVMDLQQQLAVNQQAVLAMEIIIRNNKELIRGVSRAINVTVNALTVAVTVALALANQKIVLEKIESVNATTNKLIGDTARKLKEQGTAINKQASSSQLDIATLKQAFADINSALDDIAKFRREALPQMANAILEMDNMTRESEKAIQKLEQGSGVNPAIALEVD